MRARKTACRKAKERQQNEADQMWNVWNRKRKVVQRIDSNVLKDGKVNTVELISMEQNG